MEALSGSLKEVLRKVVKDASSSLSAALLSELDRREKSIWDQISAAASVVYDTSVPGAGETSVVTRIPGAKVWASSTSPTELFPESGVTIPYSLRSLRIRGQALTSMVEGEINPGEMILVSFEGHQYLTNYGRRMVVTETDPRFVTSASPGVLFPPTGGRLIPPVIAVAILVGPEVLPYYLTLPVPIRDVEVSLQQENLRLREEVARLKLSLESRMDIPVPPPTPSRRRNVPKSIRLEVWNTYLGATVAQVPCPVCARETICQGGSWHVSHVIPVCDGGSDDVTNLRPACSTCNLSMGPEPMTTYIQRVYNSVKAREILSRLRLD